VHSGALAVLTRNRNKLEVSAYDGWYGADTIHVAKHADLDMFYIKMCDTLTILKLDAHCHGDDAMDFIVKCHLLHMLHIHNAWNISNVGLMKLSEPQNLMSLGIGHMELADHDSCTGQTDGQAAVHLSEASGTLGVSHTK